MDELGERDLTAVDILLSPDETMLALAKRVNARMLTSVPSPPGFGLDQHHQPHITALQRYVRTADLDDVYAAIEGILASLDLSTLKLTAHGLAHMEVQPSVGLTAIVIKPSPEVLDFQASLINALKPYTASGGTPDAYVRTEAEPFDPLTFSAAGISIYQLGNNGTAAKKLRSWSA